MTKIPKWFTELVYHMSDDYLRLYEETGLKWALNEAKYADVSEMRVQVTSVFEGRRELDNPADQWGIRDNHDKLPSEIIYGKVSYEKA